MSETPTARTKKFDTSDLIYYAGLIMLFIGLALTVSIGMALIVAGAVLAGVSVINSYVLAWLSRKA